MPIGWGCITSSKYEQKATLLRQGYVPVVVSEEGEPVDPSYAVRTDPITGEIIRGWGADDTVSGSDDLPETEIDESAVNLVFECQVRSIITGGLNSQGTTERFTSKGSYENVDFVEMHVPKNVPITKRDRVTNITDSRGNVIWLEEEHGSMKPTVFEVLGVAPVVDPFGSQTENFVLMARAELQGGVENRT